MKYLLIVLILFVSCGDEQNSVQLPQETYTVSDLKLKQSQINLEGQALKKSLEWNGFQNFKTQLENYDHSPNSTKQLLESTADMLITADSSVIDLPIRSRTLILRTRVGMLNSFLNYTVKTAADHEKKYNEMITAWDEVKNQLNIKLNATDPSRQELIEMLKGERRLDAERERRDSIAQDSI
ncbi:hypothetical protein BST97_14175 [Nonlabens spongiae]|uniref:Uncharacterized protein n=1 Tax=Nonlabens spongiae TaxID=331648 RepID=A0A1W6MNA4_9FLAO|nr:hypothetical protein [Nonlabens spongiae]ARN79042.1 hypothetical protein BST97_14175 [Nonlabens spongiae]